MIIASQKGKLKRRIRFYEDEITSCIFGEMEKISPKASWQIFCDLISFANISKEMLPDIEPTKVEFKFWPRQDKIEPDLLIDFYNKDDTILHIMIEVKWGAPLSPKCELVRQWECREITDNAQWLHLYLVKKKSLALKEISNSIIISKEGCDKIPCKKCVINNKKLKFKKVNVDEWEKKLGCISWNDFLSASKRLKSDEGTFKKGIENFLEKQGVISFSGFSWLSGESLLIEENASIQLFRQTQWFDFIMDEEFQLKNPYREIDFYK